MNTEKRPDNITKQTFLPICTISTCEVSKLDLVWPRPYLHICLGTGFLAGVSLFWTWPWYSNWSGLVQIQAKV